MLNVSMQALFGSLKKSQKKEKKPFFSILSIFHVFQEPKGGKKFRENASICNIFGFTILFCNLMLDLPEEESLRILLHFYMV